MRSEGSRRLGAVDAKRGEVARRIGVSAATVSLWVSGERVPKEEHRRALLVAYRIPLGAWPEAPRERELRELREEFARIRDVVIDVLSSSPAHQEALRTIVERLERDDDVA